MDPQLYRRVVSSMPELRPIEKDNPEEGDELKVSREGPKLGMSYLDFEAPADEEEAVRACQAGGRTHVKH